MASQSSNNVIVAFKRQSGLGSAASGSGATGLRFSGGSGMDLKRTLIKSKETRRDGQSTVPRHGSGFVEGSYPLELSVGAIDQLIESVLRGTVVASFTVTQADVTSITTTTSTIIGATGSWLTKGVRRGDMVKLTGFATVANNGKWLPVLGVTASTITVPAASLTLDASADTSFTLTVAKSVTTDASPSKHYYTIEEYHVELDQSESFTDVCVVGIDISSAPDGNAEVTLKFKGLDMTENDTSTAPIFTSPTFNTGLGLTLADGALYINGTLFADITGFKLSITIPANTVAVGGSRKSPDLFLGNMDVTGEVTVIRQGTTEVTAYINETALDIFLRLSERTSDPANFCAFYVGSAIYTGATKSLGGDSALIQTLPFAAGKDDGGSDRAATTVKFATSAA